MPQTRLDASSGGRRIRLLRSWSLRRPLPVLARIIVPATGFEPALEPCQGPPLPVGLRRRQVSRLHGWPSMLDRKRAYPGATGGHRSCTSWAPANEHPSGPLSRAIGTRPCHSDPSGTRTRASGIAGVPPQHLRIDTAHVLRCRGFSVRIASSLSPARESNSRHLFGRQALCH